MRKKEPESFTLKEEKILIDDVVIIYDPYKDRRFLVIPHVDEEGKETEMRVPLNLLDRLV